MGRYSISHVWNEDPDYEVMAQAMLDLLLHLETQRHLQDTLRNSKPRKDSEPDADNDAAEAA